MNDPCPCCKSLKFHKLSCETKHIPLNGEKEFEADFLKIELEHAQYHIEDLKKDYFDALDALKRAKQTIEALKKGEDV